MSRKILMATAGSLGDLHPILAVGRALSARGHAVTVASSTYYRERIEKAGLAFRPMGPHLTPDDPAHLEPAMDRWKGTEYVIRRLVLPSLREAYAELDAAVAEGADCLVLQQMAMAGPLVAAKRRIPWAYPALQPMALFSAHDPFTAPQLPGIRRLARWSPAAVRLVYAGIRQMTARWLRPVEDLRRELGLPPGPHPLLDMAQHAHLTLGLFSEHFARRQPDWPANVRVTGFPFFDAGLDGPGLSPELEAFLQAGEPPLVFTLGSAAVMAAGDFYEESLEAARLVGRRAVLVVGIDPRNKPKRAASDDVLVVEYAPYSALFPRALLNVHQCGIGTSAQALAAGRPMLCVPYSHDQPDNARRLTELGVARTVPRTRYRAREVAAALGAMLADATYVRRARELGAKIRAEDGSGEAARAIEGLFR